MKEWSEGRKKSFIVSVLRQGSRKWPPKYQVLQEALVGVRKNKATGRMAKHYRCAKCKGLFSLTNVQVDHIEPVVDPEIGFTNWDDFINRLFCSKTNLQVLCKPCHEKKTKSEQRKK